jgi:hypothetical protein
VEVSNKIEVTAAMKYITDVQNVQVYRSNRRAENILHTFKTDAAVCPFIKPLAFYGNFKLSFKEKWNGNQM